MKINRESYIVRDKFQSDPLNNLLTKNKLGDLLNYSIYEFTVNIFFFDQDLNRSPIDMFHVSTFTPRFRWTGPIKSQNWSFYTTQDEFNII